MAYYREGIFPKCILGAFPILDKNSPIYTCFKGNTVIPIGIPIASGTNLLGPIYIARL
jgi:hypothetical protein